VQEALQDVEYLTEQRVSVLHSLLAWHSAHTGNAALASEAEFEGLEAEVVRLQGRRSSGGHVLEPGTLSEPGAFVALWTEHMGASASHLGGVHGKVRSDASQTCMRHFYLADVQQAPTTFHLPLTNPLPATYAASQVVDWMRGHIEQLAADAAGLRATADGCSSRLIPNPKPNPNPSPTLP